MKVSVATGAILSMAPSITLAEEQKPIQLSKPAKMFISTVPPRD